jgi:hypothetical protein
VRCPFGGLVSHADTRPYWETRTTMNQNDALSTAPSSTAKRSLNDFPFDLWYLRPRTHLLAGAMLMAVLILLVTNQ